MALVIPRMWSSLPQRTITYLVHNHTFTTQRHAYKYVLSYTEALTASGHKTKMHPSRHSTRISFALILFRALATFICIMSTVACIAAIAHGALFQFQGGTTTPPTTLQSQSNSSSSSSSRPIDNGVIYPLKPTPSPTTTTSSSSQTTSHLTTKDPREQLFFQYLTLFLLTLWIPLTCLKDWPATRSFLYRSSELAPVAVSSNSNEEGGERGGYGNELKLGYSFPSIGTSFVMIGSTMLALNLGSNPMWRFFEWQITLMDGFGYAIFVVGIVYILLGLGPWQLRTLRDDQL